MELTQASWVTQCPSHLHVMWFRQHTLYHIGDHFKSCYSVAQSCLILCDLWTAACQASLSFTNSQSLLKLMSIESMMPSNCLILCCPLLLPSIFPTIRIFHNESVLCIRWLKYWSFSISLTNKYSGLISFRVEKEGD